MKGNLIKVYDSGATHGHSPSSVRSHSPEVSVAGHTGPGSVVPSLGPAVGGGKGSLWLLAAHFLHGLSTPLLTISSEKSSTTSACVLSGFNTPRTSSQHVVCKSLDWLSLSLVNSRGTLTALSLSPLSGSWWNQLEAHSMIHMYYLPSPMPNSLLLTPKSLPPTARSGNALCARPRLRLCVFLLQDWLYQKPVWSRHPCI